MPNDIREYLEGDIVASAVKSGDAFIMYVYEVRKFGRTLKFQYMDAEAAVFGTEKFVKDKAEKAGMIYDEHARNGKVVMDLSERTKAALHKLWSKKNGYRRDQGQ